MAAATLVVAAVAMLPLVAARVSAQESATAPTPLPATERGSIAGQVFDRESGQPLPYATVEVVGLRLGGQTDLDGRYRIAGVPVGAHQVRARHIGHQPQLLDSVRVRAREATVVNFSLATASQQLAAVEIVAEATTRGTSDVALLAMRKAAPAVMDGISAEAMSRAPGSDAADAITRVTGVSVVDRKFVIVRGLPERYSNTLLNGVELPSPEPLKKVVPLDIFPASLLESIVTAKTATPDRPADFAGGSVEIRTKEFPENRVAHLSLTTGYNSLATFDALPTVPWRGMDYLGFDAGGTRTRPGGDPFADPERWGERVRNVWTPATRRSLPELGMAASFGGQRDPEGTPLGYIVALNYGTKTDYVPQRLYRFVTDDETGTADRGFVARETQRSVDWGGIANLSLRIGQGQKFGWKNLYTRNAEESVSDRIGFETYLGDFTNRIYQVRYVTRDFMQTQLTGDHHLRFFHDSRVEWKATGSLSRRAEPDNRSAVYSTGSEQQILATNPPTLWFRFLADRQWSGHLDWQTPFSLPLGSSGSVKFGGSYRDKRRAFDAEFYRFLVLPGRNTDAALTLPPEQALAPENIGATFGLEAPGTYALPYRSTDRVSAGYTMLDLRVTPWVRVVGGMRVERWTLDMQQGTAALPVGDPIQRATTDRLWSGNATISLSERMNLRLAGYQTLARPDPRELSEENFTAVTGECSTSGNPLLRPSRISNADVRWEVYPSATGLFSVGGFYKRFTSPIIETVTIPGSGRCAVFPTNADDAFNYGAEVEVRTSLAFLPLISDRFDASLNTTLVRTTTNWRPGGAAPLVKLPMQGQSDYIANLTLQYTDSVGGLSASLVGNAFGDRIVRYGTTIEGTGGRLVQIPHVYEKGRLTLDAKLTQRVGRRTTLSLSGRNLTNAATAFYQDSRAGRVPTGYQASGVSVSIGVGRAF